MIEETCSPLLAEQGSNAHAPRGKGCDPLFQTAQADGPHDFAVNAGAQAVKVGTNLKVVNDKKRLKNQRPIDWGVYNLLIENFALIYSTDMVWDGNRRLMMKISNMAHAYGADMVRMWKASERRRTVMPSDVVFDPTGSSDSRQCINLYDGFAMEPLEATELDVGVMLELLQHLCGNCATGNQTIEAVMHWVLCWIALPLQRPGAKPSSALVFHGPQGTGKNLFFDAIRTIYGKYGVMVGQTQLEDKFNDWLSAKLMVIGNEVVTRQELYHNKNILKWVITEKQIPIRPMQQATRWESNHANVVFLSNESQPLVLEDSDRRYLVVYTPSAEDGDLYLRVAAFLAKDGAAKFMYFLQHYDIGNFGEHTKPLMTAAKADLIELGMRPTERFMSEWLQGLLALPIQVCSAEQLYRAFRRWCDQSGERYPPARAMFTKNAERWIVERVERDVQGKRLLPRLTYKVVQLKDTAKTNGRTAARCWLPRGTGPREGISEGEWAASCVEAFEKSLGRFFYSSRDARHDAPVSSDA
jgi:putative DNA primase/helicase